MWWWRRDTPIVRWWRRDTPIVRWWCRDTPIVRWWRRDTPIVRWWRRDTPTLRWHDGIIKMTVMWWRWAKRVKHCSNVSLPMPYRAITMRGSRNLQSLISPILLKMKIIVIFHICALPQLYVKVGPPWKNFLDPRLITIARSTLRYMYGYALCKHEKNSGRVIPCCPELSLLTDHYNQASSMLVSRGSGL